MVKKAATGKSKAKAAKADSASKPAKKEAASKTSSGGKSISIEFCKQ
jgi:hypothetical protein